MEPVSVGEGRVSERCLLKVDREGHYWRTNVFKGNWGLQQFGRGAMLEERH